MFEFTYRTINPDPPAYEHDLADALFAIMSESVHEPEAIVAALNERGLKPSGGGEWTVASFKSEVRRLGTWTNSVGAPVGAHSRPGASQRRQ